MGEEPDADNGAAPGGVNPAEQGGTPAEGGAPAGGATDARVDALQAKIDQLQAGLAARADPASQDPHPAGRIGTAVLALNAFMSSGWFFMLVGIALLWAAYGTMGETHTSFTFVLVVVGIAILLYGTGTQSAGEAASDKVKIYLAGGAGVLAFLVGYGIVEKSPAIKAAFQVEKKYFRYVVAGADDGVTDLSNYVALADINGDQVPAMRRGNYIEVLVPYFDKLLDGKGPVTISGRLLLYRVSDVQKQMATKREPIAITIEPGTNWVVEDGSYDFPRYSGSALVSVRMPENLDSSGSDLAQLPDAATLPPAMNGVPQ